jgi:hypothetical protein
MSDQVAQASTFQVSPLLEALMEVPAESSGHSGWLSAEEIRAMRNICQPGG